MINNCSKGQLTALKSEITRTREVFVTRLSAPLATTLAAAFLFMSGNAGAADPDIVSTKENRHLYAGNTAVGVTPNGRRFSVFFSEDGKVIYNDSKRLSQTGTWIITDDGMMCYDWRKWKDRCYAHKESGGTYQSLRDGKVKGSRFVLQKGNVGLK